MINKIKSKKRKNNSGFIALMSAVILSIILLLIATNLGMTGLYNRFNILDSELKERSSALAEACADTAILKLANNSGYTGGEIITVSGSDTCTIDSVVTAGTFTLHANYHNSFTNLQVIVNTTTLAVTHWEEI